jgi:hypothetical protein
MPAVLRKRLVNWTELQLAFSYMVNGYFYGKHEITLVVDRVDTLDFLTIEAESLDIVDYD